MDAGGLTVTRTRIERLVDYLWNNQRRQFRLGRHDCGLFATRWVDTELDTDYTRAVEVAVRREGLAKTMQRLRLPGAYAELVSGFAGRGPATDLLWSPGDVALFTQADGTETLGVASKRLVHAPGAESLVSFDASRITGYWSLECLRQPRNT